jgi:T5SS/PEP-CTERM-associated repeat protein
MVRSGEHAAKRALVGVRSAALAGTSVLALIVAAGPATTNELIDGGNNEVVDGNGSGTRPHPWEIEGDLYIARSGAGSLTIQHGGSVNNREAIIGAWNGSAGTVTVTGGGSTWNNSGDLRVGDEGAGSLIVQDGGSVRNKWSYIGLNAGSSGSVTVAGADSAWTSTQILFTGIFGDRKFDCCRGRGSPQLGWHPRHVGGFRRYGERHRRRFDLGELQPPHNRFFGERAP